MAHENRMNSAPNNGNRRESGIAKGDSDQVLGNVSHNTIPNNQSSTKGSREFYFDKSFWPLVKF